MTGAEKEYRCGIRDLYTLAVYLDRITICPSQADTFGIMQAALLQCNVFRADARNISFGYARLSIGRNRGGFGRPFQPFSGALVEAGHLVILQRSAERLEGHDRGRYAVRMRCVVTLGTAGPWLNRPHQAWFSDGQVEREVQCVGCLF